MITWQNCNIKEKCKTHFLNKTDDIFYIYSIKTIIFIIILNDLMTIK